MARKRKIDDVDPAPGPSGSTRKSARKVEDPKAKGKAPVVAGQEKQEMKKKASPKKAAKKDAKSIKDVKGKGPAVSGEEQQELRKKGSPNRLININVSLNETQKACISDIGFGGLLKVNCVSLHEKLCRWLVHIFYVEKMELVIPFKGRIKVDQFAVHRVLGSPMGRDPIIYAKKSLETTFGEFYVVFGHQHDLKAPTFQEVQKWLMTTGKGCTDEKWLRHWLLFAISTFLCPTSSGRLCVRAYHSIAVKADITKKNWCKLVLDRLVNGIKEYKSGKKKFVSGCLFFLIILYLDSLDLGGDADNEEEVEFRVAAWNTKRVTEVCNLDKSSDNEFGNLPLKAEHASVNSALIDSQSIRQFVNTNFPEQPILLGREMLVNVLTNFSVGINEGFLKLTRELCQPAAVQQA